jgi:hypothetical protein
MTNFYPGLIGFGFRGNRAAPFKEVSGLHGVDFLGDSDYEKLIHRGVVRCGNALGSWRERLGQTKDIAAHGAAPFMLRM